MRHAKAVRTFLTGGMVAAAFVLVGALPSLASAQDVDARWLPWLGCWEASEGGTEVPMLCISPLSEGQGVELTTWSNGENISTEAIHTDGVSRDADREGCRGTEDAWFSDTGSRVYLKSQYVCEGGVQRGATGLLAFANPMEWLDIKVVEVGGDPVPMVLRYRLARSARVEAAGMGDLVAPRAMSVKAARIGASSRLTVEDILEASGQVDKEAVEALIVERGDGFDVNADQLVRLADAGVPENVIDLAVAMSYPDRFTVATGTPEMVRSERSNAQRPYWGMTSYGMRGAWSFWNPFYRDPFYYSPYGYSYSPYYYNYGWYSGYYRPTSVIVTGQPYPGDGTGGSGYTHGRVVSGRGYSRGGSSSAGRSSSSPSTRVAPSSRSGGSAVSSSGARRSGGSSSSSGRSAKRRGGGGGGLF